jgi:signal transduction histidine kinase
MRLSIATKIFLAITGVLVAFSIPLTFAGLELSRSSRRVHLINHGYLRLTLAVSAMETSQGNARVMLERVRDERDLPFVRNTFTLQRFRLQRLRRAESLLAEVQRLAPGPEEVLLRMSRDLGDMHRDLSESDSLFAGLSGEASVDGTAAERRARIAALRRVESRITQRLNRLTILLRGRIDRLSRQAERDSTTTLLITVVLAIGAALTALGMLLVARRALRPLGSLQQAVGHIAQGEFGDRVQVRQDDEVGRLARAFNTMAVALEQRERDLRSALSDVDALRRENENVVQSVRAALVAVGQKGEITAANRAAHKLLGVDESAAGRPLADCPGLAAIGRLQAAVAQVLADPREPVTLEASLGADDRLWDVVVTPLRDADGTARGALVLAEEATEKVRMRQRLLASERLATIGQMAAQVAHEIRNPLSSIGLNVELLEDEVAGAESRQLLSAIQSELDRLTAITEEYLRFARLPTPRLQPEPVNDILGDLLGFMQGELAGHQVRLETVYASGLPDVSADEHQLRQAFLNVVRNACQAMPQGGQLRVQTRLENVAGERPSVSVRISDQGTGISREHLPRLFEPFFSTKDGGTGLGLALTHEIVVQHGGTIAVESEPGQGTTFEIRLPICA